MKPYFEQDGIGIFHGDARRIPVEDGCVQTCATSPPYFGLRTYGTQPQVWGGEASCNHQFGPDGSRHRGGPQGEGGQRANRDTTAQDAAAVLSRGCFCECGAWRGELGNEPTPELFVSHMVNVFREVRRTLKDDGTLWLNIGDSYSCSPVGTFNGGGFKDSSAMSGGRDLSGHAQSGVRDKTKLPGIKPKDLIGIPWMLAFALRADGWYLRSDIIWHKPNPMPESVTDRPTKSHEYIFLLSKSDRYYYDAASIAEESTGCSGGAGFGKVNLDGPGSRRISADDNDRIRGRGKWAKEHPQSSGRRIIGRVAEARANGEDHDSPFGPTRNKRTVWTVTTKAFPGAHFATFPPALIEPCILAGSRPGDLVLDPFSGSGTTGQVCQKWGRRYVGMELNADYIELSKERFRQRVLFGTPA